MMSINCFVQKKGFFLFIFRLFPLVCTRWEAHLCITKMKREVYD